MGLFGPGKCACEHKWDEHEKHDVQASAWGAAPLIGHDSFTSDDGKTFVDGYVLGGCTLCPCACYAKA